MGTLGHECEHQKHCNLQMPQVPNLWLTKAMAWVYSVKVTPSLLSLKNSPTRLGVTLVLIVTSRAM